MKKRFLLSISLVFATIVAMGQAVNVRITAFDLQDADGNSLTLGFSAANAAGVLDNASATSAALDFIYKADVDLSNVTLVTTISNSGMIVSPPTNFMAPLQLKTQTGTDSPYSYCLYDVNPRQLTPVELPATMDIATPFSSATVGWAAARLDQRKPSINGTGTDALGFAAAGVFTLLSFSNTPDVLSFKIASAATNNGNVFDVYESTDGINWNSSIASYSDAGSTIPVVGSVPSDPKSISLNSTTRFVKFVLSARASGNFYLFGISATAGTQTGMQNTPVTTAKVSVQNGLLNILSDKAIAGLDIFTVNGQLIVKTDNSSKQVNISNLPSGCYIVKVKNIDGQTSVCRFVK